MTSEMTLTERSEVKSGQRSNQMPYLESPYSLSYLRDITSNDLESISKELEAYLEDDL